MNQVCLVLFIQFFIKKLINIKTNKLSVYGLKMNGIEVIGWDMLNTIFDYLGPRDIIIISSSINTNFCKRVRSIMYSDHALLNERYDFKNRQPNSDMLDFHIVNKKCLTECKNDNYYIALRDKNNSYPDSSGKINNSYIDQDFNGITNFERRNTCYISRCGSGFDKIVLKLNLPKLPYGIKYKKYLGNILNYFQLEIGGRNIFFYESSHFVHLNFLTQLFRPIDNVIYYFLDLSTIFGESTSEFEIFYPEFRGVRLHDLTYCEVRFNIKLNNIFSIIENQIDNLSQQYNEIKNLTVESAILSVKYHTLSKYPTIPYKLTRQSVNFYCGYPIAIKKLLLCFDQKIILESCLILLDGFNVFHATQLINDEHEYKFDLNLIAMQCDTRMNMLIKFYYPIKNIHMNVLFETEKKLNYMHGINGW